MKKLLLSLAGVAFAALSLNAQTIYLMGSGEGLTWETFPGKAITPGTDGYNFTINNLSSFKMSTKQASNWDDFNSEGFGYSGAFGDAVFSSAGQTVSLAAWGENQDMPYPGSYTITINATRTSMTVKANFTKPTEAPAAYIRGNMNSWGSPDAYKFTNKSWDGTAGVWEWSGTIVKGVTFKIADANWGNINYSTNSTSTVADGLPIELLYNKGDMALTSDFTGKVTLNITNYTGHVATVTFTPEGGEPVYPENLYVIGTINGNAWSPSNVALMTNQGDGIYAIGSVTLGEAEGSTGFAITGGGGSWEEVNALRFGPSVNDTEAIIGENTDVAMGDLAWSIAPGTYAITFDYTERILTVEPGNGDGGDDNPPIPAEPVDANTIYVVGNGDNLTWDLPGVEFTGEDNVITFTSENLSKFKFSINNSTDWEGDEGFDAGSYGPGTALFTAQGVAEGQTLNLINWADDIVLPYASTYTITVDFKNMTLTAKAAEAQQGETVVYIRGAMNDWNATADWQFTYDAANDQYTFDCDDSFVIATGTEFKIADATWGAINYGYGYVSLNEDEPTTIDLLFNAPQDQNISLSDDFVGQIVFKITGDQTATATFTEKVSGEDGVEFIQAAENEAVYFNLQGQKVANPDKGIYIKVVNGKALKVVK